jgi:predicted GNAT family N-acyltransferase
VRLIRVTEPSQRESAFALRFEVFVDEQGVSPEGERDALDDDPDTLHFLALADGDGAGGSPEEVLGVGRLVKPGKDGHPHIGRVAIARKARRSGVGRVLMDAIERAALEKYGSGGRVTVALSAQVQAIPFYEAIGYVIAGEAYLDEGIWHRDGVKVVKDGKAAGPR